MKAPFFADFARAAHRWGWRVAALAALATGLHAPPAFAAGAELSEAGLRAAYERLGDKLAHNAYRRPIYLDAAESDNGLKGDIFAVVEHSIGDVAAALNKPAQWCELLTVHINNKRCRVGSGPAGDTLTLSVVRKFDQALEQAFELSLAYRLVNATAGYFDAELTSEDGPMGTSHYRIALEAIPLNDSKTFLHFTYAYEHGAVTRWATQAYLATFGSGKVGFTVVGKQPDGEPDYVAGMRGLVERNAMRYFLTVDAHLGAARYPQPEQALRRFELWFAATERYPRQLHEVDRATYLELKRGDLRRQPRS